MVCIIDYYLNAGGKTIMDNAYGYDVVSNVLSVVNKAAIPEKGKAGGQMRYNYTYDALYRLSTASGTYKGADNKAASYTLSMGYDNMHRITSKKQHLSQTGVQFEGTLNAGYELAYTYGKDAGRKFQLDNVRDINYRTEETPTEGMNINNGHKYTYDLNGNLVYINTSRVKRDGKEDEKATEQKYRWDEDNRLMVLSDNGKTSRYTYNAAGERIMKSYGTMEGVYINGAPQGITFHETDNFTLYPASIISINKNRFTKHYFIGDKRVASRIGTGLFNNVYGRNGSYVTAGQQDYAERMNQIQTQKEAYYKKVGVAPGVPTEKGAYGDPENTGVGYNAVLTELGNHDVPQGWIQTPHPNTTPGTNPGPPVSWNDPSNPDDPQAGYGYIPNDTTKEETFFYHSDHLGSTSYITDDKANITQYDAYLPYGELLVDEHSSSEDLPYKFNGKEMDEETGLYYYGARYMNPMASIWYGVDAFAEKYVESSGYVFCIDNPIKLIDSDGNKWDIHTSKNKDGKTNVLITVTGVVYNNSSDKKININKVRDQIKAQIESRYTFSSKKYNVKTNINLRVVNSVEDIQKDDHVFEIVDQNRFESNSILANSDINGLHIRVGPRAVKGLLNGSNTRTIPHELGHSAGLDDANIENNGTVNLYSNLMTQTGYLRHNHVHNYANVGKLEDSQIQSIIHNYNTGQINRRSPISNHIGIRIGTMSWTSSFLKMYTYKRLSR